MAAGSLGLEISRRTRWRRRPSRLIGNVDGFSVDIEYAVGRYSRSTVIHLFLPPGPWDETRFMVFPPSRSHSVVASKWPDAYVTTGDADFDDRLAVSVRGGVAASAQRFLTIERRQALLALHDAIPGARFIAGAKYLASASLVSSFSVDRRHVWKTGRMSGTHIVRCVEAMSAAAEALIAPE
jgi:hypothetical protein